MNDPSKFYLIFSIITIPLITGTIKIAGWFNKFLDYMFKEVKHEALTEINVYPEAKMDGAYASLQSGGVKSKSLRDLNFGEILPYMHFINALETISEYPLDTDPEYIPEGMEKSEVRKEVLAAKRCWPGDGVCINSANEEVSLNGLNVDDAKRVITQWLEKKGFGAAAVTYKLRDWLFSRQRYWGEPFPILHFEDGTQRVLDVDELPLCPPEIQDYKPSGDGRSPLAKAIEWVEIVDPKTEENG